METLEIVLEFINFLLGIGLIFFTIIIFSPLNKYKIFKVKEEQLLLQKTLITTIFFSLFLLFNLISFISPDLNKQFYLASNFLFNVFMIIIISYNFFMTLEIYNTYKNPVHYFNRLFRQYKFNYWEEIIIIIIGAITVSVDLGISYISKDKELFDIDEDGMPINYLILINYWKTFVMFLFVIVCIILYYRSKSLINRFYFNNSDKLIKVLDKRRMNYYLYLVYALFYLFPLINKVTNSQSELPTIFKFFATIFFYVVIIDDFAIHMSEIAASKFCEYKLKRTLLGYFCSFFYKPEREKRGSKAPLALDSSIDKTETTYQNDISSSMIELTSHNNKDKELIQVYKNNIFFEDYFLSYFDQILNIITSSISQVYNSKYFSTQANEQNLTNKLKIEDISDIGGNMKDTSVSALGTKTILNTKSELGEDTVKFDINKNREKDDLKRFKEVLENKFYVKNNNNFLNIKVDSFFTPKCVESIYEQKIKGKNIANCLLSHMNLNNLIKNKNIESSQKFASLLASNSKEKQFTNMKNTSIKTFDKNFTLDIFDTDENEISLTQKGVNGSLFQLLDTYFEYIHGKGINGTFIPSLVGVFKIKINDFKTLLVLITKYSLVDNVPRNSFSYWQLLRILKGKPQKVSSSQFNTLNSLIKDDSLFERPFQIQNYKENPNYNKIAFKNFNDFKGIITSDIEFLRQVGSKNFDLLLMYYQFENTQKSENQGVIKIKQTNEGPELVEASVPKGFLEEDMGTPIPKARGSRGSIDFLSVKGGFFDEENLGSDNNMKNMIKEMDKIDNNIINGFEGLFDNFNCICFFTFENVFDIRRGNLLSNDYYTNFKLNVMRNFTEYKK